MPDALTLPRMPRKCTAAEQTILEYIAAHTSEFLCMTIGQLASTLHLSDATISRFARHVGCCDFKHLKQTVVDQVIQQEGPAQKLTQALAAGDADPLSCAMRQQMYQLEKTLALIDTAAFDQAVEAIDRARRVFLFAKNASRAPAQLLEFRLRRIGVDVRLVSATGSGLAEHLAQMAADDLAVVFSFSKLSDQAQMVLGHRAAVGFPCIRFTSRHYPTDGDAAIRLYVYRGEENAYHPMSAPVAVAEALALAVSAKRKDSALCQLSTIQQLKGAHQRR